MGQYFLLANITKREVVDPGKLNQLVKFKEWLSGDQARVLVWLLRRSDESGGGDIDDPDRYETLGRWAGDQVLLVGDYDSSGLYKEAGRSFKDISEKLRQEYNDGCDDATIRLR